MRRSRKSGRAVLVEMIGGVLLFGLLWLAVQLNLHGWLADNLIGMLKPKA